METKWYLTCLPHNEVPHRMIVEYKDVLPSVAAKMFPEELYETSPGFFRRVSNDVTYHEPGSFVRLYSRTFVPDPWYFPGNPGFGL